MADYTGLTHYTQWGWGSNWTSSFLLECKYFTAKLGYNIPLCLKQNKKKQFCLLSSHPNNITIILSSIITMSSNISDYRPKYTRQEF